MNYKKRDSNSNTEPVDLVNSAFTSHLPIEEYSKELLYTVESNNITLLVGETGSGKTTSKLFS